MTRVVVNKRYGGFGLSDAAQARYAELTEQKVEDFYDRDLPRDDPNLVRVVEEMGEDANGRFADLRITEIPDDMSWEIQEYDGTEWVAEKHRTW